MHSINVFNSRKKPRCTSDLIEKERKSFWRLFVFEPNYLPGDLFSVESGESERDSISKIRAEEFFLLQVKVGGGDFLKNNISYRFYEIEPF